jgi:hypothetical protein
VPYDETIIDWIRALPQRHYRPETQDWITPARREHLRAVCGVIAELQERAIAVEISQTARARLMRADVGRAILRGDSIEIAGPYSERRLPALRALPERRFDAERMIWTIALTRAGALEILALADDTDELVLTRRARHALQRCATANPSAVRVGRAPDPPTPMPRRSPRAHWRHYTTGAVFANPARERINVPGIGWCVRIRVDPHRRLSSDRAPRTTRDDDHPTPFGCSGRTQRDADGGRE